MIWLALGVLVLVAVAVFVWWQRRRVLVPPVAYLESSEPREAVKRSMRRG